MNLTSFVEAKRKEQEEREKIEYLNLVDQADLWPLPPEISAFFSVAKHPHSNKPTYQGMYKNYLVVISPVADGPVLYDWYVEIGFQGKLFCGYKWNPNTLVSRLSSLDKIIADYSPYLGSSLSCKPAFPSSESSGMTYREWLIGQCMAQVIGFSHCEDGAQRVVSAVDAVLEAMEESKGLEAGLFHSKESQNVLKSITA